MKPSTRTKAVCCCEPHMGPYGLVCCACPVHASSATGYLTDLAGPGPQAKKKPGRRGGKR